MDNKNSGFLFENNGGTIKTINRGTFDLSVSLPDVSDVRIDIYSARPPRPGFEVEYNVVFNNEGTTLLKHWIFLNLMQVFIGSQKKV